MWHVFLKLPILKWYREKNNSQTEKPISGFHEETRTKLPMHVKSAKEKRLLDRLVEHEQTTDVKKNETR